MDSTPLSPVKRIRKPRTTHLSEAELVAVLADTKTALREIRKRDREQCIQRMGTMAWKAGLNVWDSDKLFAAFQELARNGMLVLCLVCIATVSTCCMLGEQPRTVRATLTTPPGPRCWHSPDDNGAHCLA